jgi:hypothetical protein
MGHGVILFAPEEFDMRIVLNNRAVNKADLLIILRCSRGGTKKADHPLFRLF